MNKVLRELADRSGTHGQFATNEYDLEKFAELLVRECVSRLEYTTDEDGTFLLEYFGLKR